jgi:GDPmannose 4,6-dehydratase
MAKTAVITGVSGQDGAYLAKLLLERGYRVIGQVRRGAPRQTARLDELGIERELEIVAWDVFDMNEVRRELEQACPDEIYNLAGPSSVANSFEQPLQALEIGAVGTARMLEAARQGSPAVRYFQPSSAEMFGSAATSPQSEATPFQPRSPYAVAKLFCHWQTASYRESYKFFGACGILFNHESPLRGRQFVTRKITSELAEVKHGRRDPLALGNLDVSRDWGFAGDYVDAMWRILQQPQPGDYVIATGRSTTVRKFVELTAACLGMALEWSGAGRSEVGIDRTTGRTVVEVDPAFFRPAELVTTVGDATRARDELGWRPSVDIDALAAMMAEADERRVRDNRSQV